MVSPDFKISMSICKISRLKTLDYTILAHPPIVRDERKMNPRPPQITDCTKDMPIVHVWPHQSIPLTVQRCQNLTPPKTLLLVRNSAFYYLPRPFPRARWSISEEKGCCSCLTAVGRSRMNSRSESCLKLQLARIFKIGVSALVRKQACSLIGT